MHAFQEDNREFLRVDHEALLNLREIKGHKTSSKGEILMRNVSPCGLLFRATMVPPALSSLIWVELDPKVLNICSEIEEDLILSNGGILGRVVRIAEGEPGQSYDVGVCFLRKKNMTDEEIEEICSDLR